MLRKIKNKRGASHVEIVLSFVIFVGFLIFLIAIFKPFKSFGNEGVYLDTLERKMKELSSARVNFQTLNLNEDTSVNKCFCLSHSFKKVIVKNESQDFVNASSLGNLCINSKERFFYISSYQEFVERVFSEPAPSECTFLDESNYTLGLFRSYDLISFKRIEQVHNYSINEYEGMKGQLGIPSSKDFAFGVRETGTNEVSILDFTRKPAKGVGTLARTVPIQLVYNNGEIKYAMLSIQVW